MARTRTTSLRWLVTVLAAIVVVSISVWRGLATSSAATVLFRTVPLEWGNLTVSISATGTVEPEEVVNVGAQVAGMIREFGPDPADSAKVVDYGTVVNKGTVLTRIDDAPYRAAVSRARAQVQHSEAGIQQAEAQVMQAEANALRAEADIEQLNAKLQLAEREYDRMSKLLTKSSVTVSEHDTAESTFVSAKAAMSVGKATLVQAKAAIEDAKANVAKMRATLSDSKVALETSEINLGYCTITSPVDGSIIDRRVNVGQTVVASLNAPSLFLIAKDLNRVQVWASVNEADIGKVQKGQQVSFRVDAYPHRLFQGKVAQIRLNAMMTQNVVTYTVVVTVDNSEGLLPYLTANVDIEVDRRQNVLLVPNGALRWQPEPEQILPDFREGIRVNENSQSDLTDHSNSGLIWIAQDGFVRPVQVVTGLSDGSRTEITGEGLAENMPVVIGLEQTEGAARSGNPFIPQIPGKKKES